MIESHRSIEIVLAAHAGAMGDAQTSYRNHVYRVLNFALALAPDLDVDRAAMALAYHDIGIWTHRTWDYLPPSVALARAAGADEGVCCAIEQHHKLLEWKGQHASLVEPLRRADLIDVSLGLLRQGVSSEQIRAVRHMWPNAGFHRRLGALLGRQLLRQPWRPLPMLRW